MKDKLDPVLLTAITGILLAASGELARNTPVMLTGWTIIIGALGYAVFSNWKTSEETGEEKEEKRE